MPALAPNLASQVADHLRRRILSGQLAPGETLLEIPLAQEFGTSRGPIRDAFLTLSKEGLLVAKANVGVRVADKPSAFQRELMVQLRRQIECAALLEWFERAHQKVLGDLSENLSLYEAACRSGHLETVVELDMQFHRIIVESVENGSLVPVWIPIVQKMFLRYSRHRSLMESYSEHSAIVKAIAAKDKDEAKRLLVAHIQ